MPRTAVATTVATTAVHGGPAGSSAPADGAKRVVIARGGAGRERVRTEEEAAGGEGAEGVEHVGMRRSKYHDENILLAIGMSSQGMSDDVRVAAA